jgi:REP element-mobilizing transposase RayT
MQYIEKLEKGKFYHVYNRGINSCNIFNETENYAHFYRLYEKYIPKVADTYAWVLMRNHFHFLVYIKRKPAKTLKNGEMKELSASQQFSNLFNSYVQAFNNRYNRHGGLFERPFKRKLVQDTLYLKNVIIYIHQNPIHHKICKDLLQYGWSSYIHYTSSKLPESCSNSAIELFKNKEIFFDAHKELIPPGIIEDEPILIEEDSSQASNVKFPVELIPRNYPDKSGVKFRFLNIFRSQKK